LALLTYGHSDPLFVPPRQGRVGLVGVLLQMRDVAARDNLAQPAVGRRARRRHVARPAAMLAIAR